MSFSRAGLRLFNQRMQNVFRGQQRRIAGVPADVQPPDTRSGFQKLWDSPVGPKTVHFWAPVFKWGIVIAGISDFARPASQLSITQNLALTATGLIWTRWCFIIKPRNIALASVNFFLGLVGLTQVTRIVQYRNSLKEPLKEQADTVKGAVNDPKGAMERVKDAK